MILLPLAHLDNWLVRMKRLVGFFLLLASLSANRVDAQPDRPSQQGRSVVAVSWSAADARLGLLDEAVSFWNTTLQEIGVCYSLGPVTRLVQPVPEEALQSASQAILDRPRAPINIPPALLEAPGEVTISSGRQSSCRSRPRRPARTRNGSLGFVVYSFRPSACRTSPEM
jgi:hypothetical protein